jgi:sortase A
MNAHARNQPPIGILRILGEAFLTVSAIVVLYLVWTMFLNPVIVGSGQQSAAARQSAEYSKHTPQQPDHAVSNPDDVPVSAEPGAEATPIAVIYIPRLGSDWKRVIRDGTDDETVLDSYEAGVGHYTGTAMPGGIGNFAIAAHDTGYGNTFLDLSKLKLGDHIYVQTTNGWYTYEFRNFQFVQPTAVDVIDPVPTVPAAKATQRLITMTTCDPPFHARERTVAYGTFVSFDATTPAALIGKA